MRKVSILSPRAFRVVRKDSTTLDVKKGLQEVNADDAEHEYMKHHGVTIYNPRAGQQTATNDDPPPPPPPPPPGVGDTGKVNVAKLEKLADLPIADLTASLGKLSDDELSALRDIEVATNGNGGRTGALKAIDAELAERAPE